MTIGELIEQLQDFDPDTEIRLAMQPNYPMRGSIRNICMEYDKDGNEKTLYIACSGHEDYGCPRDAWDDSEIHEESEEE